MAYTPTPDIFSILDLPTHRRVKALRTALAAGADPNAFDQDIAGSESLLGRAFRVSFDELHALDLIKEMLAQGANPLVAQMKSDTGMVSVFERSLYLSGNHAFSLCDLGKSSERALAPLLVEPILKACLVHGHRDAKGNNALLVMLHALHPDIAGNLASPIRQALRLGFSPDQPIGDQPNPVIHLAFQYALSQVPPPPTKAHDWMWDYIEMFVEAGTDMDQRGKPWANAWVAIENQEDTAANVPAFQRLMSLRQSQLLGECTPPVAAKGSRRRI